MKNTKRQSAFENSEDSSSSAQSADVGDLYSFSQRDLEFIVKFKEEYGSDTFRRILHSVCPSIYGHEIVKGYTSVHYKISWDIIGDDVMITIRSIAYHDTSVVCFFFSYHFNSWDNTISFWRCKEALDGSEQSSSQRRHSCHYCW